MSVGAVAMSLSTIIVAANAQLLRQLKLQRAALSNEEPSSKQNPATEAAVMNAAFTKALVALIPTCMLFCGAALDGFGKN